MYMQFLGTWYLYCFVSKELILIDAREGNNMPFLANNTKTLFET